MSTILSDMDTYNRDLEITLAHQKVMSLRSSLQQASLNKALGKGIACGDTKGVQAAKNRKYQQTFINRVLEVKLQLQTAEQELKTLMEKKASMEALN